MLKKIIRYTIGIALILLCVLLVSTAVYEGYNTAGIKGACIAGFSVVAIPFAFLFTIAWMWKKICIANNLTPRDIEEITGHKL